MKGVNRDTREKESIYCMYRAQNGQVENQKNFESDIKCCIREKREQISINMRPCV